MDADPYLHRIGLTQATESSIDPDLETLERLVDAHVRSVPFENLAIVGHPHEDAPGPGVSLFLPDLYEKIVRQNRGGFCFEVNGLFNWLLGALGYDVDRCAARVVSDADSVGRPPANHHTTVVHLDRRYLVDVGTGTPQVRVPVPLDGTVVTDDVGAERRVVADDVALSDFTLQLRRPGAEGWEVRYRFRTAPRKLTFFEATCEYLANEPDGTFTSGPTVQRSTREGSVVLDAETLTRTHGTESSETTVTPDEWDAVLRREFAVEI